MGQIYYMEVWFFFVPRQVPHSPHPSPNSLMVLQQLPEFLHKPRRPLQWALIPAEMGSLLHLWEACSASIANALQVPTATEVANGSLFGLVLTGTRPTWMSSREIIYYVRANNKMTYAFVKNYDYVS